MGTKTKGKSPSTKTAAAPKSHTHVNIVLDRSGSMQAIQHETVTGLNVYLDKLREDKETEYSISLTQFDANNGPELTVTWDDKPLSKITGLSPDQFIPRGWTPLYDAIGECVRRVKAGDRTIITIVITDGQENASKEFNLPQVQALIKQKEGEGWTFVFMGTGIDSYAAGGSLGVSVASTANYNPATTVTMFAANAQATMMRSASARTFGNVEASKMAYMSVTDKAAFEPEDLSQGATASSTITITGNQPFTVTQGGGPALPSTFPTPSLRPFKPANRPTPKVAGNSAGWTVNTPPTV